ncbi:MAG: peptidoglycan-binding domain-containing protein [Pseudomonadota bacterium]
MGSDPRAFRALRLCLATLLAMWLAALPVVAADIALVVTNDVAQSEEPTHATLVGQYRGAGFRTYEGRNLDRAALTALLADFETQIADADRLVIHLSGRMSAAAGVPVFLPQDVAGDSQTAVLTGGLPLPLFLEIAGARPGRSLVALARSADTAADPAPLALDIPQGVLVLRGETRPVNLVVSLQMLAGGLAATEIDAAAADVTFEGLVSDLLRLRPALVPNPGAGAVAAGQVAPRAAEATLQLDRDERRQVQEDLTTLGYDTNGVDGVFGEGTRAALRLWQQTIGGPVSGYLNATHLAALTEQAAARRAAIAAEDAARAAERDAWDAARTRDTLADYRGFLELFPEGRFAARARDRIETMESAAEAAERIEGYRQDERGLGLTVASVAVLERRLAALGYTAGPADGTIDTQTRRSIAAFQAQKGLTPTGYLDTATLQRLIIATVED